MIIEMAHASKSQAYVEGIDPYRDYRVARSRAREKSRKFADAAISGDVECMVSIADELDYGYVDGAGWPHALRMILGAGRVPRETQNVFLRMYILSGDHIRDQAESDLLLIKALRVLLPGYTGPDMVLYRGQNRLEPRKRSYGPSWSESREVAEAHARG